MKKPKEEKKELNITELQVQKLNLKPGDTLMVTVQSDELDEASLDYLSKRLKFFFPNNKVALFGMGMEGYIKFTVASQAETCETSPAGYCSNCDCGKRERVEAERLQGE
jgi:hypothetical protein